MFYGVTSVIVTMISKILIQDNSNAAYSYLCINTDSHSEKKTWPIERSYMRGKMKKSSRLYHDRKLACY
jgi:hypothetical protein